MKRTFLILSLFGGLMLVSTLSYAECVDLPGLWHCFPKDNPNKVSTGDCKDMECPDGCVEAPDGTHGYCCQEPTGTNCRMRVLSDGCIQLKKIDCLPTQYCDDQGACRDISEFSKQTIEDDLQ